MNSSANNVSITFSKQKNKVHIGIAIFSLLMSAISIVLVIRTSLILGDAGLGIGVILRQLILGLPYLPIVFALITLLSKKSFIFPMLYCGCSSVLSLISLIGDPFVGRVVQGDYLSWWGSFARAMYGRFNLLFALIAVLIFAIYKNAVVKNKKKIILISVVSGVVIAVIAFVLRTVFPNLLYMSSQSELIYISVSSFVALCLCIPFIALNMATSYIVLKKRPTFYILAMALQFVLTICVMLIIVAGIAKGMYPIQDLVYSLLIGEIAKAIPLVVVAFSNKGDSLITGINDNVVIESTYNSANGTNYTAEPEAQFCSKCGTPFAEGAVFCAKCGNARGVQGTTNAMPMQNNMADAKSTGYAVLGFFFPVIGLILYLVWKDQFPLRAKSAGTGALIGVISYVVFVVLVYFITFLGLLHIGGLF